VTPLLVLVLGFAAILWLLARDARERPQVSPSAWLALAWVVLVASRPVTSWIFGATSALDLPGARDDGHPLEAIVYLSLIVAGVIVLLRRSVSGGTVIAQNGWLVALYVFWLTSVLWSDYPFITAKRLTKDLGNVVMVLILLTERDPATAVRATLVRCADVCLPLSLVLIRYYPSIGRSYVGYQSDVTMYVGVTLHKNSLGILAVVGILSLAWDLLARIRVGRRPVVSAMFAAQALVLLLSCYLLVIADSATSLLCLLFGVILMGVLALPVLRRSPSLLEIGVLSSMLVVWIATPILNVSTSALTALGRDSTLTSRVDIWNIVLLHAENPLVGAGFNTFWAGRRLRALNETVGVGITQAHNGYLETYLNGGFVGLGLLVFLLASAYRRLKQRLSGGRLEARIRFTLLFIALIHNVTEASFNTSSLFWFVTLFAVVTYEPWTTAIAQRRRRTALRSNRHVRLPTIAPYRNATR
jgi:exopolysaccharide production protein ExoQ